MVRNGIEMSEFGRHRIRISEMLIELEIRIDATRFYKP